MNKKISVLALSAFALSALLLRSCAAAGKVARIGFLDASTAAGSAVLVDVFRQELSKLGWIEGKNFAIEYRFAEGKDLSACLSICLTGPS